LFLPKTEVCDHIVENPAPVIFIDTCVFLDILRSPIRKNISTDTITTTLKLIEMSEKTPREVWLVTNEKGVGVRSLIYDYTSAKIIH